MMKYFKIIIQLFLKMKITIVAGARPNFIKISPLINSINKCIKNGNDMNFRLVHTGQHYDKAMSGSFFEQLNIKNPDINLECGGGTQAEQTASIMMKFEKELLENKPDIVLVVGDVTSTMACTITSKKLCIDVAHIEAGIRSYDMTMPEEINRIITDSICDYYFITTKNAGRNLINQNINKEKIHFVGNTMIDTLIQNIENIRKPYFFTKNKIKIKEYFLLTLHRPSNVDNQESLKMLLENILDSTINKVVIFPVHPRTKENLDKINFTHPNLLIIEPQGYLEFLFLINNSMGIITDSGGITEEATFLNIPCLTLRNSTERPETVKIGTNKLLGNNLKNIKKSIHKIIEKKWKKGRIPKFWDGNTSDRIISILYSKYHMNELIK